jgi:L-asparaginase II
MSDGTTLDLDIHAPLMAEVVRGNWVESRHRGVAAAVDRTGRVVRQWGDIDQLIFPRSAVKPLQALPLLLTGAADAFRLSDAELAIACGSHLGERRHVATVRAWLDRLGLDTDSLECGAHAPFLASAAEALFRSGQSATQLHNNCSGKHAGFLTVARHLGIDFRGYIAADHPVQRHARAALEEMYGHDLSTAPGGIDGCGIPVLAVPVRALAQAMAKFANPDGLRPELAAAIGRLSRAMAAEPFMVAGSGGFPTYVMSISGGSVLLKNGAEGVFCAALPRLGLGVALKMADGSDRGAIVAMGAVLRALGAFTDEESATLAGFLNPRIRNVAGRDVGEIRSSLP